MTRDDAVALRASLTSPERFGDVFEQHHAVIWRYVARLAGRDAADDLAGEVFVTAFVNRHRFDPSRGEVRSWLYGIATNRLRTRFRSEFRARRAFDRVAHRRIADLDPIARVDDADESARAMRVVLPALSRLPRADREIVVLYAWEGLSYDDISVALGIAAGTVRSRLWRARGRLRELAETDGELVIDPNLAEANS